MDHVLLVVPAADDDVVDPGKRRLSVSNSPVHVPLEGGPRIPQTKRHPLVLEQAEGGGDAGLLHVFRVDWDLMIPLPQVDLGENRAAGRLGGEVEQKIDPVITSYGNNIETKANKSFDNGVFF